MSKKDPSKGSNPLSDTVRLSRQAFLIVGVFSFFVNLLYLVSPLYMLQIYDRVLLSGSRPTLFYLTMIAVFALVIFGALEAVRLSILSRIGVWFRQQMSGTVLQASLAAVLANPGATASSASTHLKRVQNFLGGRSILPFFDAPWSPFFLLLIWLLHPLLGVVALLTGIILFVIALVNEATTRSDFQNANSIYSQSDREAAAALQNAETVHAMNMLPQLQSRSEELARQGDTVQIDVTSRAAIFQGASRFVRMTAQVLILGAGALLVLEGLLSAGAMIAASILMGRALAPIDQSIGAWKEFVTARNSYKTLLELMEACPEKPDPMTLPDPKGQLVVEGLYLTAPNSDKLILNGVTFGLNPGEILAIAGPSAAGKSTLCRVLCGALKPTRGTVRMDGAEVDQWPRAQFGDAIGYMTQSVELFPGTVRQNIARMKEGATEAVTDAAMMAGIHEMILSLPEAYDTPVGPGGLVLSGGQRQRIGLARALYGSPKLVILDEPNSNLDQTGEQALMNAIRRLKQRGVTVLLVAHRQSVLNVVDKILMLQDGKVAIFGPRDDVLNHLAERARFSNENKKESKS